MVLNQKIDDWMFCKYYLGTQKVDYIGAVDQLDRTEIIKNDKSDPTVNFDGSDFDPEMILWLDRQLRKYNIRQAQEASQKNVDPNIQEKDQ